MAPKTTSKAEKAREEELEKGRIAAMKASNAEDPLWKMQRKEQALASDLGIDPDLKAKEFLAALMTKGTEATGLSELKKDAGISDPKAVLAASNLNQAYKVLKGLWRFGMTRDLLRIAAEMGLIKLLKTLKKRHPDGKIKESAGKIIEKWMAMEQAGSATDSVSKDVSSFTTSSSSAPSSASESASVATAPPSPRATQHDVKQTRESSVGDLVSKSLTVVSTPASYSGKKLPAHAVLSRAPGASVPSVSPKDHSTSSSLDYMATTAVEFHSSEQASSRRVPVNLLKEISDHNAGGHHDAPSGIGASFFAAAFATGERASSSERTVKRGTTAANPIEGGDGSDNKSKEEGGGGGSEVGKRRKTATLSIDIGSLHSNGSMTTKRTAPVSSPASPMESDEQIARRMNLELNGLRNRAPSRKKRRPGSLSGYVLPPQSSSLSSLPPPPTPSSSTSSVPASSSSSSSSPSSAPTTSKPLSRWEKNRANGRGNVILLEDGEESHEWLGNHELVGVPVLRKGVNDKGMAWEMQGTITGWLPAEAADDNMALFHCSHCDGDAEDLDEHMVREAMKLFSERDCALEGSVYDADHQVVATGRTNLKTTSGSSMSKLGQRLWRNFKMKDPDGEMMDCKAAMKQHIEAGTKIIVQQENPKTAGTMSHKRYEIYKCATTLKEMLKLGARSADLFHDYAKGFIKVDGLPDVVPMSQNGLVMSCKIAMFLSFGSDLVNQKLICTGRDAMSGKEWKVEGEVTGWLPSSANGGKPALYRCRHYDHDEEDLEEDAVRAGIAAYKAECARKEALGMPTGTIPMVTWSDAATINDDGNGGGSGGGSDGGGSGISTDDRGCSSGGDHNRLDSDSMSQSAVAAIAPLPFPPDHPDARMFHVVAPLLPCSSSSSSLPFAQGIVGIGPQSSNGASQVGSKSQEEKCVKSLPCVIHCAPTTTYLSTESTVSEPKNLDGSASSCAPSNSSTISAAPHQQGLRSNEQQDVQHLRVCATVLSGNRKWTTQELTYANVVIKQFREGILALPRDGDRLSKLLAELLCREVRQVRRKLSPGKTSFESRRAVFSSEQIAQADRELRDAYRTFRNGHMTADQGKISSSDVPAPIGSSAAIGNKRIGDKELSNFMSSSDFTNGSTTKKKLASSKTNEDLHAAMPQKGPASSTTKKARTTLNNREGFVKKNNEGKKDLPVLTDKDVSNVNQRNGISAGEVNPNRKKKNLPAILEEVKKVIEGELYKPWSKNLGLIAKVEDLEKQLDEISDGKGLWMRAVNVAEICQVDPWYSAQ